MAEQLTALGLSRSAIDARLGRLSDVQLQQLAAQVDLIRAGGMIQGSGLNRDGPIQLRGASVQDVFSQVLTSCCSNGVI